MATATLQPIKQYRRLIFVLARLGLVVCLLGREWMAWPDSSPWLGPLWFFRYGDLVSGCVFTLLLLLGLLPFVIKPNCYTFCLFIYLLPVWYVLGLSGDGISC